MSVRRKLHFTEKGRLRTFYMYKNKRILALIPARGGSKRLPGKNLKPFNGKPLICWTIEEALASTYIDKVVVSTDNRHIAAVAKKWRADAPFIRPKELATDHASSLDVILHALNWLEDKGESFDLVMLLQPTSPLREKKDIDGTIVRLFGKKAQAVVSVCEAEHNPLWSDILPSDFNMKNFLKTGKRYLKKPKFYRLNGAVYLSYVDYLVKNKGFIGERTYAYLMNCRSSVDIDTKYDFEFAEFLKLKYKR